MARKARCDPTPRCSGRVIGAVKASGRVCLLAGSVFVGQIQTRRLVVEEGALLRPE